MAKLQTAEARFGKRGITAFFGETPATLHGHGTAWPEEKILIRRIHQSRQDDDSVKSSPAKAGLGAEKIMSRGGLRTAPTGALQRRS